MSVLTEEFEVEDSTRLMLHLQMKAISPFPVKIYHRSMNKITTMFNECSGWKSICSAIAVGCGSSDNEDVMFHLDHLSGQA